MPRSCAVSPALGREFGRHGRAATDEGDRIGPINPCDDAAVVARSSHEAAAALGDRVMVVTCYNCCPPPGDEAGEA